MTLPRRQFLHLAGAAAATLAFHNLHRRAIRVLRGLHAWLAQDCHPLKTTAGGHFEPTVNGLWRLVAGESGMLLAELAERSEPRARSARRRAEMPREHVRAAPQALPPPPAVGSAEGMEQRARLSRLAMERAGSARGRAMLREHARAASQALPPPLAVESAEGLEQRARL